MERISPKAPIFLLGVALAATAVLLLVLTAGMTYFQDTWGFLIERRGFTAEAIFSPHNEHIVVLPVLITQLFLRVFGMTSSLPEYVLLIASLLVIGVLFFIYVRRRVGEWLALFATVVILLLGPAWQVLLWPFELGYVGAVLFGLAMLLALEREDRRGDLMACAFLTLALGFSTLGIPFLVGAAVAILTGPRERWLSRAYLVAIPAALFAAWYLGWGHEAESQVSLRNALASPRYVAEAAAVSLGAVFGLGTNPVGGSADPVWGRSLLVAVVALLALRQIRRPGFSPRLWPIAAIAASNWFLAALNQIPGREPEVSRYQYAGAIFVLMVLADLLDGVALTRKALALGAAVMVLAVGPNLVVLKDGASYLDRETVFTRADTAAIEIARETVDPGFQLLPEVAGTPSLVNVYAGSYLAAVEEHGSPAYSEAELASAPEAGRRQADIVLSQALPLSTLNTEAAFRRSAAGCAVLPPGAEKAEVELGAGTHTIELAPGPEGSFRLRRFAELEFPVPTAAAPGGSATELKIPADTSRRPWRLRVDAQQLARVCS